MKISRPPVVAVVGPGTATPAEERTASEIGAGLARAGWTLVCGGLGGVMAAAARGHRESPRPDGVLAVGLLPGAHAADGNPWLDVALPTGLGEGRNLLVVRACEAVIAIGGAYGTLSEIALALRAGTPVIGLGTWDLRRAGQRDPGIIEAAGPGEALRAVARLLGRA
jgi:uncharacterized protein (TIGR00725 family)